MNNPALYNKYCKLLKNDVKELLEDYRSIIKWKKGVDRNLDIGCADGGTTSEILKKYLPSNFRKLVGSDINEKMVKYANEHYGDLKTHFVRHDIQSDIPEDMKDGFDHVFSFYTLHWVPKTKVAISNIYSIMADGGDCLLMFLAYSPFFTVYRLLTQNPKWRPWLTDAELSISPYQDSTEPEKEFRLIMEDVGFTSVDVICKHKSYTYEGEDCINYVKGLIEAVSPFSIPEDLNDEYLEDFIQTAVTHQLMKNVKDENGILVGFHYSYSLLVAYGCK